MKRCHVKTKHKLALRHFGPMTIPSASRHSSLHRLTLAPRNLQPKPRHFWSTKGMKGNKCSSRDLAAPSVQLCNLISKACPLRGAPRRTAPADRGGVQNPPRPRSHRHPRPRTWGPGQPESLAWGHPPPLPNQVHSRRGGGPAESPEPPVPQECVFLPSKPRTHSLSKAWRKSSWSAWTCSIFGFFTGNTAAPAAAAAEDEEEAE